MSASRQRGRPGLNGLHCCRRGAAPVSDRTTGHRTSRPDQTDALQVRDKCSPYVGIVLIRAPDAGFE